MASDGGYPTGSKEWHKEQIEKYAAEKPYYVRFAALLREVLQKACDLHAPLAIVSSRPKSVSSFAKKALIKAFKYDDPVHQLTDLCGARVITHTQDQVDRICEFVKQSFRVDAANSLDVSTRLRENEFGYLSQHYIVQLKPGELLGVSIPGDIGDRKAEIQVRTLLQHAWADISHDRLYKGGFQVPFRWKREAYRLAALLEDADGAFLRLTQAVDAYMVNYGAYLTQEKLQSEVDTLRIILENEPEVHNKPGIALQIARLCKAAWNWAGVVSELEPYLDSTGHERPEILLEHGHALCQQNRSLSDDTQRELYSRGRVELEAAAVAGEGRTRVQALSCLGWSYARQPGMETEARRYYREAYRADPSNPYALASYLEFEIHCGEKRDFVDHMQHTLLSAIETCRAHADAGVEVPWAYLAMGRFYLLLNRPFDSLAAYAKAVQLCVSGSAPVPEDVLDSEREFVRHINYGRQISVEDSWIDTLLLLGKSIAFHPGEALPELKGRALRRKPFRKPVTIVAGGALPEIAAELDEYRIHILTAFDGFDGTIFSGGTTIGVPGMVGEVSSRLRSSNGGAAEVIGYIPRLLPSNAPKDERYTEVHVTSGEGFSPAEPLQNWVDMVAGGVKPCEVKLLGVNGGPIAGLEYRLAIAFGAEVGVVQSSGRAAAELLPDSDWLTARNLIWLPLDTMAIRAFVNPGQSAMDAGQLEAAGRAIHEKFLEDNRHRVTDSAMRPWSELDPGLRESNQQQAAYAEQILRGIGCGIRTKDGAGDFDGFTDDEVELMAEMEHGRWVVERLAHGWRYGTSRDLVSKVSPFLVAWGTLPPDVKDWDRKAVRQWPELMDKAGLEIYRL